MKQAWKEIKYNKTKYLLIELILVLMIFMVLFLSGLANGLGRAVSSSIENTDANYFIISEDAENLITFSNLDVNVLETITPLTTNKVATLDIQRMSLNVTASDFKIDVTYYAIDEDSFLMPEISEGNSLVKGANTIVLDDSFKAEGIKLGDVVSDSSTGIEMKVVGFTHDQYYGHISVGVISTDTYTKIRNTISPNYKQYYHAIAIQGDDIKNIAMEGISVVNKATIIDNLPGYSAEQTTINMILWVLVVISAAILGVFFYVITIQKEKQFGVLKAIGMKTKELNIMIMSQVFVIAGFGMVLGNLLAIGTANMLPASMPFYLKINSALMISVVFILISILSSLITTRKIAKVDPIITIGGND